MDYLGWIVFGTFLSAAAYLLYGIEKGKPWALRYVQTLGCVDPAARSFHTDPSSPYSAGAGNPPRLLQERTLVGLLVVLLLVIG